jgi:hypothetical protein
MMLLDAIQNGFREGGWGMYPTTALGLWALIETSRQIKKSAPAYRAAAALSFATILSGLLGTFTGLIKTLQYSAEHPLEQMFRFIAIGLSESLHNFTLAMIMLTLVAIAYAAGDLLRRNKTN